MGSHWSHWKVQSSLCALADLNGGGIYHKFYFSLYFFISWLFRIGSHWSHWKAKSSLCALAVLNGGGSIISFTFPYIFLLVDCFEWALIGHMEKQRVHSVLWQFQLEGGRVGSDLLPPGVNLKIWAVSNGLSLFTLKSKEFTLSSGSFEWGEGGEGQIYPPGVNMKIWAHFKLCSCFTELFCFYK